MSKHKYSRGKQLVALAKANNWVQELDSISIREAQRDLFDNDLEPVVHHSKDIQKETSGDSSKIFTSSNNNVDNIENLELFAKDHDYVDFYQQNDDNKSYKAQECPKYNENLNVLIDNKSCNKENADINALMEIEIMSTNTSKECISNENVRLKIRVLSSRMKILEKV